MRRHSLSRLRPAQVELLRSMQEPVDYRMTIRTRDRLFSFRASLKDLKVRCLRVVRLRVVRASNVMVAHVGLAPITVSVGVCVDVASSCG